MPDEEDECIDPTVAIDTLDREQGNLQQPNVFNDDNNLARFYICPPTRPGCIHRGVLLRPCDLRHIPAIVCCRSFDTKGQAIYAHWNTERTRPARY